MNIAVIDAVEKIFLETNFANLFSFPGLFKAQAAVFELKTDKFIKWFDSLGLPIVENVWINAANMQTDKQETYSYEDFKREGYGELISRSIAIPAFINKGIYADGGLYDNPCMSQWPLDSCIFVSQLMMPYRTTPGSRLEKLSYAWDCKAFQTFQSARKSYNNLTIVYPDNGEISSTDFGISKDKKLKMVYDSYKITLAQLEFLKIPKQNQPVPVKLALSGGGIRSGGHIGVVRAMLEYNYIPVEWSGTSGGAAFAVLFAAISKVLNA